MTQLEMFQNPLSVIGRTLGHTPFGVFSGFQVTDFDLLGPILLGHFIFSYLVYLVDCLRVASQSP